MINRIIFDGQEFVKTDYTISNYLDEIDFLNNKLLECESKINSLEETKLLNQDTIKSLNNLIKSQLTTINSLLDKVSDLNVINESNKSYNVSIVCNIPEGCNIIGSGSYPSNRTNITIGVIPKSGYEFVEWTVGPSEKNNLFVIDKLTENLYFEAQIREIEEINDNVNVEYSCDSLKGVIYSLNESDGSQTLTVSSKSGYNFNGWYDLNNNFISSDLRININKESGITKIEAMFVKQKTIIVTPITPSNPSEPNDPETPDTPSLPETPDNPDTPSDPDTPGGENTPDTPRDPNNPDNPDNPSGSGDYRITYDFGAGGDPNYIIFDLEGGTITPDYPTINIYKRSDNTLVETINITEDNLSLYNGKFILYKNNNLLAAEINGNSANPISALDFINLFNNEGISYTYPTEDTLGEFYLFCVDNSEDLRINKILSKGDNFETCGKIICEQEYDPQYFPYQTDNLYSDWGNGNTQLILLLDLSEYGYLKFECRSVILQKGYPHLRHYIKIKDLSDTLNSGDVIQGTIEVSEYDDNLSINYDYNKYYNYNYLRHDLDGLTNKSLLINKYISCKVTYTINDAEEYTHEILFSGLNDCGICLYDKITDSIVHSVESSSPEPVVENGMHKLGDDFHLIWENPLNDSDFTCPIDTESKNIYSFKFTASESNLILGAYIQELTPIQYNSLGK